MAAFLAAEAAALKRAWTSPTRIWGHKIQRALFPNIKHNSSEKSGIFGHGLAM
ncbi:Uncharacterised protein [Chlamydia trachomatis]|nr:Uncharacterised protein [Chlamydia trachomatis]